MPDNKEQNQLKDLLGKLDGKQLEQVSLILVGPLFVQGFAAKRDGAARRFNTGHEGYKQYAVDAISDHSNDSPYQFMKDFGEKLKGADEMSSFKKMLVVKDEAGEAKINENVKEVFEGLSDVKSESSRGAAGRFFKGEEGNRAISSRSIIKEAIRKVDQDAAPKIGPVGQ
jgi:hypothetical protein